MSKSEGGDGSVFMAEQKQVENEGISVCCECVRVCLCVCARVRGCICACLRLHV